MGRSRYFRLLLSFQRHAMDPVLHHCGRRAKVCIEKVIRRQHTSIKASDEIDWLPLMQMKSMPVKKAV